MTSQDIDSLDQILFSIYNYGFPNTGMPGSQEQMSEEQARAALLKWRDEAVVAYLHEVLAVIEKYKFQPDKNSPRHVIGVAELENDIKKLRAE